METTKQSPCRISGRPRRFCAARILLPTAWAAVLSCASLVGQEPSHTAEEPAKQSETDKAAGDEPSHFDAKRAADAANARRSAATILDAALDVAEATLADLDAAVARAARALAGPDHSVTRDGLESLADGAGKRDVDDVERGIERIIRDLRFAPTLEAPLAEGWPPQAPVHEIVVRHYPRYRMAVASLDSRGESTTAFWKLFGHIQSNDIPMTAPVQIDDGAEASRKGLGIDGQMAFLYTSPRVGSVGEAGPVEVVDVEPLWTVGLGQRGYRSPRRAEESVAALEQWVREHAAQWEVAGPARVMGFNSPMMMGDRRFWEVEIPIRPVESGAAAPARPGQVD